MDINKKCSFNDCKRKLPLTAYACRCKLLYCNTHKYSEDHNCSYNFYEEHKKEMLKNLSTLVYTKAEKTELSFS